jgi:ribosomal-protein-alanine N-acetyltransferase
MIDIVGASPDSSRILAALHAACFDEAWTREAFDSLLASPGAFALIGRQDGLDRGFVLVRVVLDEAEVLSVGVSPPARRRGLARCLLAEAARQAGAAGATRLFLEVSIANDAALRLYRKMGFVEIGRRQGYYRNGAENGLTMRTDLPLSAMGKGCEVD